MDEEELPPELTRKQLEELADRKAREILGVPDRFAAWELLYSGELGGLPSEWEFKVLRTMIYGVEPWRPTHQRDCSCWRGYEEKKERDE